MLVNPIFDLSEYDRNPKKIDDGIYDGDFNLHLCLGDMKYEDKFPKLNDGKITYGVADNIQQVLDFYKEEIESDIPYCIEATLVRKSEQEEYGGWRWHKWGQYIGMQQPTHEYLRDEPLIEEVIVFSIYRIRNFIKPTKYSLSFERKP